MSDHISFPVGLSSPVATTGNDCQIEDRLGERERGTEGRGEDSVGCLGKEEMIFLKD